MAEDYKTVLLVEDNEDNRTVYRSVLQQFGYAVIEARNGEDAIRMASEEKPDIILMDWSLPIVDGRDATRILKSDPVTTHIPIIAMTAHALATDRAMAQEIGCEGYVAKPVEPRRLVKVVYYHIGPGVMEPYIAEYIAQHADEYPEKSKSQQQPSGRTPPKQKRKRRR